MLFLTLFFLQTFYFFPHSDYIFMQKRFGFVEEGEEEEDNDDDRPFFPDQLEEEEEVPPLAAAPAPEEAGEEEDEDGGEVDAATAFHLRFNAPSEVRGRNVLALNLV